MTRSQVLAALRRAFVPALLAAVGTFALVASLARGGEPTYQVRVGIAAVPNPGQDANAPEYGSVVSLAMPALPELAVSAPVRDAVAAQLGDIGEAELLRSVTVELVPDSAVARITATRDTPRAASTLLRIVVDRILKSPLLSPVGRFHVLGNLSVEPLEVKPDPKLAMGLALFAAAFVALLAVAAVQVLSPRLLTADDVERVVRSTSAAPIPIMPLRRGEADLGLLASRLAVTAPDARSVVAFPAGGSSNGLAEALSERLGNRRSARTDHGASGAGAAGAPQGHEPAVVSVRLRRDRPEQLAAALLRAEESGHRVGVVVVK
jgi:capsular polysaccharide biosynthesis protein